MEAIIAIAGIVFFWWVFTKCPKKDGSRTKCPKCGSKHTKHELTDYTTAHRGGRVNNFVKCLECGHIFWVKGAHDSEWL